MESGTERKFVTNLLETVEDQRRRLFRCFILFTSRFPCLLFSMDAWLFVFVDHRGT